MKFKVDPKIFEKFPGVRIGVLSLTGLDNTRSKEQILNLLRTKESRQNSRLLNADFGVLPETVGWRKIYEQFGSKPRDFRSSIESLLRRVKTGNPLPQINPLVDLYNYLSIHYYLPAGAEDLDKIVGDVELMFAKGEEKGKYIGGEAEESCYPGEIIYKDDMGFICRRWNWREGERTMIEETTKNAVLVLEALPIISGEKFSEALVEAERLVKDLLGGEISLKILSKDELEVEIR